MGYCGKHEFQKAYSEPSQTSMTELFYENSKTENTAFSRKLFSQKRSIVDVRLGFKYAFEFTV